MEKSARKTQASLAKIDELYLVELPFKTKKIDPNGSNVAQIISQIQKSSKTIKLNVGPGQAVCSDVKLSQAQTPNRVFSKKTYVNANGEKKVVFQHVQSENVTQFTPEYFADFLCESRINPDSFVKIFEDKILGKRVYPGV